MPVPYEIEEVECFACVGWWDPITHDPLGTVIQLPIADNQTVEALCPMIGSLSFDLSGFYSTL